MTDEPLTDNSNREQAAAWNGPTGKGWADNADDFDWSMRAYHPVLMTATAITPSERVLDVGCGAGKATLDAAHAASPGQVLGVDLSAPMLAVARHRARASGATNVEFVHADAQVYPFEEGSFDLAMSRNGVMFFGDRTAAFTNIARALRPGGRVAFLVWQEADRNEWITEVSSIFAAGREQPPSATARQGPCALGSPTATKSLLLDCGFTDVVLTSVSEPMYYGRTVEETRTDLLSAYRSMLDELGTEAQARVEAKLDRLLEARLTPEGVAFGSAAWLITARR